jgi:hypothetical protein
VHLKSPSWGLVEGGLSDAVAGIEGRGIRLELLSGETGGDLCVSKGRSYLFWKLDTVGGLDGR